jgi:hypothetical protein
MQQEKLAVELFGVPFAKTCIELDFKRSYWYWIKDKNNNYFLCNGDEFPTDYEFVAFAPQFHEIAKLLPEKYKCFYSNRLGDLFINSVQSISIDVFVDFNKHIDIKNNNFAQAAAELYLQLKKVNLL